MAEKGSKKAQAQAEKNAETVIPPVTLVEDPGGEPLPSLAGCMRGGRDALDRASLAVWEENNALGMRLLQGLAPDVQRELVRLAGTQDRQRDEAYADLLRNESIAKALPVLAGFFDNSLDQEAALNQMEAAGSGMALSAADCTKLLRVALYATNGENEAREAELCARPDLSFADQRTLAVLFDDVLDQEGVLTQKGGRTRQLNAQQQAQIKQQTDQLARSEQDRQDVDLLLQSVQDPTRTFPAAALRGNK